MANKLVGEDLIKFIRAYRDSECLWNTSSPLYRNVMLRIKCYNQISSEFEMSEMDVKKKINNLRTCFMKEWKRVESSKLEARDDTQIYQPTMHWFKEMLFLSDTLRQKRLKAKSKKEAKIEQNNSNFNDEDYLQDGPEEYHSTPKFASADQMDTFDDSYISESPTLTIERAIKLEDNIPVATQIESYNTSPETMNISRPAVSENNLNNYSINPTIPYDIPKTEVDDFCKSLASQMKNLSLRSIVELQMDIQNLVSKKRLAEMLNSGLH